MEKLDNIDKKIVSALMDNSKYMSRELSRKLKVHPNTLLQRLKKLEKSGIIMKYSAVIDFSKIDKHLQALIFLDVDMEKQWEDALRPVAKHPDVVSFSFISGSHDALIYARVKDESHLASLLRRFQSTKVVTHATTHIIIDHLRQPHEYNPLKDELRF